MAERPVAQCSGQDGNIFNIVGIANKALVAAGLREEAQQMKSRVFSAGSYDEALCIISEYVEMV